MSEPRIIKKYPNRRLYDTATSCYITLADIKKLVLDQTEFQVVDAKTGQDLTRSILLQIILEEESVGNPMFSSDVLSQVIRSYGNAMQGVMGTYLENSIKAFIDMQKKFQEQANPMLNTELWGQFMKFQAPTLQGMVGNYLEQSSNMFMEMQQQLQNQSRNMFNFPFQPFTPPAADKGAEPASSGDKPGDKKRS